MNPSLQFPLPLLDIDKPFDVFPRQRISICLYDGSISIYALTNKRNFENASSLRETKGDWC